jgi:ribosomal protein S18 acetylase RimI-like enzyme
VVIRPYLDSDRAWAEDLLNAEFGGRLQARRGELIDVLALRGFVAQRETRPVGLLTYRRDKTACELAFMAAVERHQGIGSALLDALRREVSDGERIWLVTTNDNLEAIRFFQRRGFVLSALRPGAVDEARRTRKPTISIVGNFGIPIRDEIELEARLTASS